jgi:hypothetical protein
VAIRFQWHPLLHRDWAKERLCFWRLGFYPTYDRELVKERLEGIFQEQMVHSYAPYELIGIHDLMLRIWLPTSLTQGEFNDMLAVALGPLGLVLLEPFAVDEMITHWVWAETPDRIRQVASEVLEEGLAPTTIDNINKGHLDKAEQKKWEDANVIAPSSHGRGIKFFIVITASGYPARYIGSEQSLKRAVVDHLANAKTVTEKSLYEGSGFGHFIVMGKVPYGKFKVIFRELIDPINKSGLTQHHQARTYTHICTDGLVDFRDVIPGSPIAEEDGASAVEDYLSQDESATLEVKSSAFVDVAKWLNTKKLEFAEPELYRGVLKAITGMLNADGGTVVVGAGETHQSPFVKPLARGELGDFPLFGNYIILGLEQFDFQVAGPGKNWDRFLLRLGRTLRDAIDPSPVAWVTLEPATLSERTLAVITVRAPDSGWYYLRDLETRDISHFFVRQGNETREMSGADADVYKRNKGRI